MKYLFSLLLQFFLCIVTIALYLLFCIFAKLLYLFTWYCNCLYLSWEDHYTISHHCCILVVPKDFPCLLSHPHDQRTPYIKGDLLGRRSFCYSFPSLRQPNTSWWKSDLVEAAIHKKLRLRFRAAEEPLHFLQPFLRLRSLNLLNPCSLKVTPFCASHPSSSHYRKLSGRFSSCFPARKTGSHVLSAYCRRLMTNPCKWGHPSTLMILLPRGVQQKVRERVTLLNTS